MLKHPLAFYLQDSGETVTAFAARVGLSRVSVHRIMQGAQSPHPKTAKRIAEATGGAITIEQLLFREEAA